MSTIHLVYCRDNADVAEHLSHDLGRIGIPFRHLTNQPGEQPGALAAQVLASEGPVLLILTDNFLRSKACMASALAMYQTLARQSRLLTVVAAGRKTVDGGQAFEPVPTQFDRVVHAIQYMNFWQTAYLDQSAGLNLVPLAERERYEQDLETVRGIANEIGELFSALRDAGYVSLETLQADAYALFFRHFNLQEWHEQYRKLSAIEADMVPPIREAAEAIPVAEPPVLTGGLLVPVPAEPEAPVATVQVEAPSFNGINKLLHELSAAEPAAQHFLEPDPDPGQSTLERLIDTTPTPPPAATEDLEVQQMAQDAWFWLEKGYVDRGLELFRLAIEQHPDHAALRADYELAQARYGTPPPPVAPEEDVAPVPEPEAPATDHTQEAASYDQMGASALSKGDFLLAKYCWDRVTELDPKFPGIYRKLALLTSEHLTEYKETAAHYLEEALAADPGDADLHFRLGTLLHDHLDQPEQALQHFRDTVVLAPDHARAWLALAQANLESGSTAEAETFYRQAIQIDPALQTPELDARFLPPPATAPEEPQVEAVEATPAAPEAAAPVPEPEPPGEPELLPTPAPEPPPAPRRVAEPLTVLITGATSGIGRATAEVFAREGHRVILTGRRAERLEAIGQHLQADYHSDVLLLPFDVREEASVREHLENLPEGWQQVDILINNAGLAKGLSPIHEGNLDHWETMIDTNIKGLLYVTRCVAKGMVERRRGHIINLCSSAGKEVYAQGNVYCATKFAVDALTRAIRLDLHRYNIRVSQVSPGHVEETEFAINRFDGDAEKANIYEGFQPLKASDVAEAIYFMATRPAHVNISDIVMFGTQQASATVIDRSGR